MPAGSVEAAVKATIPVKVRYGFSDGGRHPWVEVFAYVVCGDWAVLDCHPEPVSMWRTGAYQINHLPTGETLRTGIENPCKAAVIAQRMHDEIPRFTDRAWMLRYAGRAKAILREVLG